MSPRLVETIRWGALVVSIVVVAGFVVNDALQFVHGTRPSPLKLVMLFSGIGLWWFAMTCVDNLLLSIAVFDI